MIKMPISNPVILTMDLPLMEDSRLQFVDISGSQSEPVARQRQKNVKGMQWKQIGKLNNVSVALFCVRGEKQFCCF